VHVLLLEILDRLPIETELACDVADRFLPAAAADEEREALREERILREPGQLLLLHLLAVPA
jgi:hypothetical protein